MTPQTTDTRQQTTDHRIAKVLIANRGEIARRIARTCRDMGIAVVAVFSDPDAGEPLVAEADEAVRLPGEAAADTYLNQEAIIAAARATGADAVHPGYGFLAENARFAQACADAGVVFIGPSAESIAAMGSKIQAKQIMTDAGVPVLPSTDVSGLDEGELAAAASAIAYPLLVKASAGGGGKGMRVVGDAAGLAEAVDGARREAQSAFDDDALFLERYIDPVRHIEFQIFGDHDGNIVHLFERECSIQRRHQKIVEETPSPALDDALRREMGAAAVSAAKAVGYVGAGTVEFLLDGTNFYFLEMNTRLQVEHAITEMTTGIDLVAAQIRVAQGEPLPEGIVTATPTGHAIEARVYAEDASNGFLPATGTMHRLRVPDTVRTDAGPADGSDIPVHYDPMIAKVVSHATTRADAAAKLAKALTEAEIYGITTNRDLLVRVLGDEGFLDGDTSTDFLDRRDLGAMAAPLPADHQANAVAATIAAQAGRRATAPVLSSIPSGWRNAPSQLNVQAWESAEGTITVGYRFGREGLVVEIDGEVRPAAVYASSPSTIDMELDGIRRTYAVFRVGRRYWVSGSAGQSELTQVSRFPEPEYEEVSGSLVSPMPGKVVGVAAEAGTTVARGDVVVIIEAMKMEHAVRAPSAGVVASVDVAAGDQVEADQVLAVVVATDED